MGILPQTIKSLYGYMLQSRYIDEIEVEMTNSGEAFFHVSGAGHEALAAINEHLIADDWLHCHYRDKSLMLARGIPAEMFFLATLNKDGSHSRGRQMNAHMSDSSLNVMSLVGPVGNNALQAVGVAEQLRLDGSSKSIVLCAMGDGTTQQGEVLEAIAHASREQLPVLFLVEDNSLAISTRTDKRTFFSTPQGDLESFHGVPICHCDGSDVVAFHGVVGGIVSEMRADGAPRIVRVKLERLSHHTNADDQRMYRSTEEIQSAADLSDPIQIARQWLLENGFSDAELQAVEAEQRQLVQEAARSARQDAEPNSFFDAKPELPANLQPDATEYRGGDATAEVVDGSSATAASASVDDGTTDASEHAAQLTMLEAIREVLKAHLTDNKAVTLFGEDIEDPKGDVFGITKGLSTQFPDRVVNSPLAEASIVGLSIGRALAGGFPVAFLQFADFLPIAFNQIFSEMGSMFWRTDGQWKVPMIVMITCGAYRPGLGPFHANTLESIAAHTPGIDVMMPSSAGDAAGLLNAAFGSGRPTLFFYPKSCLNIREKSTSADVVKQLVPIGKARKTRYGDSLTFVGWGNTVGLCEKVADTLGDYGVACDVIDLRTVNPWDTDMVTASAKQSGSLIVVHEDTHTAGMGAEIVATVSETLAGVIEIRRITRSDTYVPCNFGNQLEVLPSYQRILETAVELLGGSIEWDKPADGAVDGVLGVEAVGSSPSDEAVTVMAWNKAIGDSVKQGEIIAELEGDKASVELASPYDGTIAAFDVAEGDSIAIGKRLLTIKPTDDMLSIKKQPTKEEPGTPIITNIQTKVAIGGGAHGGTAHTTVGVASDNGAASDGVAVRNGASDTGDTISARPDIPIGIVDITTITGSRRIENDELIKNIPDWQPEDIVRRTGIESRQWIGEGESAISMAVDACNQLMERQKLQFGDIDLLLCCTETPEFHTPSNATLIQNRLNTAGSGFFFPAYDINAACSGYLYALQIAYDFLQSQPTANVILITAEALSTKIDKTDPNTAPIFADASTATLLTSSQNSRQIVSQVIRPALGADGETGDWLSVPIQADHHIQMDGQKIFSRAVKEMITSLRKACSNALISLNDLTKIVAHQANQRILNAVASRLKLRSGMMFSNIKNLGNTSSSTIPLCLQTLLRQLKKGQYVGLTAFGGGFTFGGAILKML